jgi:adenine deaminase
MTACYRAVTDNAAQILGLKGYGIEPGCRADLTVLQQPLPCARKWCSIIGAAQISGTRFAYFLTKSTRAESHSHGAHVATVACRAIRSRLLITRKGGADDFLGGAKDER